MDKKIQEKYLQEIMEADEQDGLYEEPRQIVVNRIITPDGTELISKHRHDYVTHVDKNGLEYMVDGGEAYLKRTVHEDFPYTEATIYADDDIELIREHLSRGGRGKDGKQPLKYVKLKDMSNAWLEATIDWEEENRPSNTYLDIYRREKQYREENNIFVED